MNKVQLADEERKKKQAKLDLAITELEEVKTEQPLTAVFFVTSKNRMLKWRSPFRRLIWLRQWNI